ncbi:acetoacetate ligase [Fusarium pseudoanthophilum]|uniref:Acetoacetate ligase n=1 Tax=Fusarium pseudoanthophilum TaxID=48495 RepID=A0A8H5KHC2_9HYPO|nr:acetoacetate ligase [Fusarium pseudoanthophilum]
MAQDLPVVASYRSGTSWRHPHPELSRLDAFRRHVNRAYKLDLRTYAQLHKWSVDNVHDFCKEVWMYCGVVYSQPPERVANGIDVMWPRPEWFPGARMNYTENLLSAGLAQHPDAIAISACLEGGVKWRHLSWVQLRNRVAQYASALQALGVTTGDRVAAVLTNSIEAVVLLLAAGAIGAIFSSTAPDMGADGIINRYAQVRPKVLFVDTEVVYTGRRRVMEDKMKAAAARLKQEVLELSKVVVVSGPSWTDGLWSVKITSEIGNVKLIQRRCLIIACVWKNSFKSKPKRYDSSSYLLIIRYTFSTRICHSAGGALLQQKKEFILSGNITSDSVFYQYTTTGWMMWNYLVGALSVGARIVLYDGSPLYPSPAHQIHLIEQQGVTHWGTSPKLLTALKQSAYKQVFPLESLQIVISAGSPLSSEIFRWFYDTFPNSVGLFSGSGGTDLVGSILGGTMISTIHEGELAVPQLGMRVEIWDQDGKSIENTGDAGGLIISTPFFSMPTTFWGENGDSKYFKAYFEQFPGVWCHGDFVKKNPKTGGYVILGRSDGVLNPGGMTISTPWGIYITDSLAGVRFGTSELYNVVDKFTDVEDCIAVGRRLPGEADEQVVMFLKMKAPNFKETAEKIRDAIRQDLSPRHVPTLILEAQDIPYTLNGKKMETLVRDILCKRKIANLGSVGNPECLVEYERFSNMPLEPTSSRL